MVQAVSSYCNGTIENVKSTKGITSTTNDPQGATLLDVKGLERLDKNIDILSPGFPVKAEVWLTIHVENVHAVRH